MQHWTVSMWLRKKYCQVIIIFSLTKQKTILNYKWTFTVLGDSGGVVKSLDFCPASLSPLAAFTSGAYFLHNGRQWQWICEFYTANFKDIFEGP